MGGEIILNLAFIVFTNSPALNAFLILLIPSYSKQVNSNSALILTGGVFNRRLISLIKQDKTSFGISSLPKTAFGFCIDSINASSGCFYF